MFLVKLLKHTMAVFLCFYSSHEFGYISSMERSFQRIKKKEKTNGRNDFVFNFYY